LQWPQGYTASSYSDLYAAAHSEHTSQQPQQHFLEEDYKDANSSISSAAQPLAAVDNTASGASLELLLAASSVLSGPFTALCASSGGCSTVARALSVLQSCSAMFFRDGNAWEQQAVVHLQKELQAAVAGSNAAAKGINEGELIEQWIAAQHKRARLAEAVLVQVRLSIGHTFIANSSTTDTDSWCWL
jgi:hypothetical protein